MNLLETIIIMSGAALLSGLIVYLILRFTHVSARQYRELERKHNELNQNLAVERAELKRYQDLASDMKASWSESENARQELDRRLSSQYTRLQYLEEHLANEKETSKILSTEIKARSDEIADLNNKLAVAKASLHNLAEKMENQQADFERLRETSLLEFRQVANALLEEKSEKFAVLNKQNIEQVLKPLGENLSHFRQKVEETYDKESKQRFSLEEKIRELMELNNQISREASNLTQALKGQAKTQGDWGEMILENILEYSGLSRNREYFVQESFRDENGNLKRPDIIVKYPDQRYIIIDSKVSLVAYERMSHTDDPERMQMERASHIRSIRNHIDELSAKEYDKFDRTLDFVMLFVPVEPAYLTAMQHDPELWNYAYAKRVLLISPTNLIAALKMVADIWKRDDQNRNAREIAKRGEILYEKFVSFVEDLESISKYLNRADESWKGAMSKLRTGRGNLIGQAEKLRKLGLKPKKSLPEALLEEE